MNILGLAVSALFGVLLLMICIIALAMTGAVILGFYVAWNFGKLLLDKLGL